MAFLPQEKSGGLFGGIFGQGDFTIDQNATPEMIKAKRAQIAALMPQYGRAKYVGEGLGQLFTGIATGRKNKALDKFEGERSAEAAEQFNRIMTGGGRSGGSGGPLSILGMASPQGGTYTPPEPPNPNDVKYPTGQEGPAPQGNIDTTSGLSMGEDVEFDLAGGIKQTADALGMSEHDLATIISYETAGTFDPAKAGPTTQWGQHRGLIQFGEPQAEQYGVDWNNPLGSQLGADGAIVRYFKENGWQPGMGLMDAYSIVNAGGPGRFNASDANNGGAPGTVRDKVTSQMDGHRQKAAALLGGSFAPGPGTQVAQNTATGGPQLNDLMMAAQNPWLTPAQRGVINTQVEQLQRQQQLQQERQWDQQDPLYQLKLQQAQLDLEQDRSGAGGNVPASVQELQWRATQAGLQQGTPEYQSFVLNGGGDPATFRALHMQAQAAGLQQGTPEYAEFMATRGAGLQAGAKTRAENLEDVATGGAAEGAKDLGKASIAAGVSAWEDYGKLQSSIGTIGEAITAIDNGADSGMIAKYLPNVTEASASLNNAMDRMGLDVVGSVTFGALSEGELRLAMNTAVPRDLEPPELRSWLLKKQAAQQKAANMLSDAAQYLTRPGNTINGWIEKNKQARQAAPQGPAEPARDDVPANVPFDPQTPDFSQMSDEELQAYIERGGQ